MTTRILLWLLVLFFTVHLSGHIYELLANIPNWRSGEVADVMRYRDFYAKADPKYFFIPVHVGSMLVSLICLFLAWNQGGRFLGLTAAAFLIAVGVFIFTIAFFVPVNNYIWGTDYDAVLLKSMVQKWVMMEYVRVTVVGIGLICSIWALETANRTYAASQSSSI
jgi:hypothetical protein